MQLPAILQDTATGLLANTTTAAKNAALSYTEDNAALHPYLVGILGDNAGRTQPTPGTKEGVNPSPDAGLPASDIAPEKTFMQKYGVAIAIGVVVVGAVALGYVKLGGK